MEGSSVRIDATGLDYRALGTRLKEVLKGGAEQVELYNVCGQRYIGAGIQEKARVDIYGTPGNDLGSFMGGLRLHVHGNAQDGCGNTLDGGELVIYGHAGDIVGYAMRGGKIFIRGSVGYRAAIHMKEYKEKRPVIVIGGTAQPFLGEYMAGGTVILLRLTSRKESHRCSQGFIGTGMHGGVIYIRGQVEKWHLGKEVAAVPVDDPEKEGIASLIREFCAHFGYDAEMVLPHPFTRIYPRFLRPYGRLYAY